MIDGSRPFAGSAFSKERALLTRSLMTPLLSNIDELPRDGKSFTLRHTCVGVGVWEVGTSRIDVVGWFGGLARRIQCEGHVEGEHEAGE